MADALVRAKSTWGTRGFRVRGDSTLVVGWLTGTNAIRTPAYVELWKWAVEALAHLAHWDYCTCAALVRCLAGTHTYGTRGRGPVFRSGSSSSPRRIESSSRKIKSKAAHQPGYSYRDLVS